MIKITLEIAEQEIPTQDLRALFAAALIRGSDEANVFAANAIHDAARAMRDAEIVETV